MRRWWEAAAVTVVGVAVYFGLEFAIRVVVLTAQHYYPRTTFSVIVAVPVLAVLIYQVRQARRRRALTDWFAADDWRPVDRDAWPWIPLVADPAKVRVLRAWSRGPHTVGELSWTDNQLGGAVDRGDGFGIFVVLRLPAPAPAMAMRRWHTYLGDDERLRRPALRLAWTRGEIPPWTVRGDELFAFETVDRVPRPDDVTALVERVERVADLVDLRDTL